MKRFVLGNLSPADLHRRVDDGSSLTARVETIIRLVSDGGDDALFELTEELDGVRLEQLTVSEAEIDKAFLSITPDLASALHTAAEHITAFHSKQLPASSEVVTAPGVTCRCEWRPIRRVGLYVPGGSAPLLSTALMLGIPARLAGCAEVVLCTPPTREGSAPTGILAAAKTAGVTKVFTIGGGQAIAAMAVGTETVPKVDKIFGPGNRFVTEAKSLVSRPPYNTAIDMTAGPSELLIIADAEADARWVAADLLAQAEHGEDSRVVLVTTSEPLAARTEEELESQIRSLPRAAVIRKVIDRSPAVIASSVDEALAFSEGFAPEHLLLAVRNAAEVARRVTNAGSVFIGERSSVVFGDYASGANHTLPTAGASRALGGLTVQSFMKPLLFQTISGPGNALLSPVVASLARAEGLEAHARAAEIRREQ